MSRPMTLVNEDLLKLLYNKHQEGLKYVTLLKNYGIHVSPPTITKWIDRYTIMVNVEGAGDIVRASIVRASIFPEWLVHRVQVQDTKKWLYVGVMPFGHWERVSR